MLFKIRSQGSGATMYEQRIDLTQTGKAGNRELVAGQKRISTLSMDDEEESDRITEGK